MSVERISQVLNAATGVSAAAKLVLIGIANHDGDGGAWPSIATLARYAEMSPRSVQRHIATLEDAGLVQRVIQGGGSANRPDHSRPNLYRVTLTSPPDSNVTPPPDISVTPPPDTDVIPPLTLVSPEPSLELSREPSVEPPTRFDEFWDMYPRRVAKKDAEKAWRAMSRTDQAHALVALPHHIALWRAEGRGTRTVPYPATWLRRESWCDELAYLPERQAGGGSVMDRITSATRQSV